MLNKVNELKDVDHMSNKSKLVTPNWDHMEMHLTCNISIKNMKDATRHLELEEESLEMTKATKSALIHTADKAKNATILIKRRGKDKSQRRLRLMNKSRNSSPRNLK